MKKKILIIFVILIMFSLGGCQVSSVLFLSFHDMNLSDGNNIDNSLTKDEFFAKNLVIIPEKDNKGNDPLLNSAATLLVDTTDNKAIYADHVYDKLYPASFTKLLTALVALKYGNLTDPVTISYEASHVTEPGAKLCGFEEGDVVSLETLLNSLLIYSGNDAAVAIADYLGGSEEEFVNMMNDEAKLIGAVHSNFVNANGLHDDNQYTTAYDLYLIFNKLLDYDIFREIMHKSSYTAQYSDKNGNPKEKKFSTTDLYLSGQKTADDGISVIGGKTGTTSKAGNCLILLSKDKNAKEYISVILRAAGSDDLYSQMTHLLSKEIQK